MTAVLTLDQVGHRYPHGDRVLDGVHLELSPGEVVGIGGPSGSGKSTLLRIAAGVLRPSSGEVRYDGTPAWAGSRVVRPRPGHLGVVRQDPVSGLDPRWSIGRSVTEPLRARHRRTDRLDPAAAARDALDGVGLRAVPLSARPTELSVGQLQRVVLARALLARPAVLLADEPTSALDVTSGAGVLHLLRRFADDGAAVLVISHDEGVLGALCDRRLRLDAGSLTPLPPDRPGAPRDAASGAGAAG